MGWNLTASPPGSGRTPAMVGLARAACSHGKRVWWVGLPAQRAYVLHELTAGGATVLGLEFGTLLSGAIIAETIFAWPGLGRYLINGITGKDFPTVQGAVIAISATFVLVNLVVDLIYTALDPRVQYQ